MAAHDPVVRRNSARTASLARLARLDAAGRRQLTEAARAAKNQRERDRVLSAAADAGETPLSTDEVDRRVVEARRQRMTEIGRLGVEAKRQRRNGRPA